MTTLKRRSRRLHRLLVPVAALPLALTSLSGALYGTAIEANIDLPWLLKLHTGNFGLINLQPIYAPLLGLFTLALVASGTALLLGRSRAERASSDSP